MLRNKRNGNQRVLQEYEQKKYPRDPISQTQYDLLVEVFVIELKQNGLLIHGPEQEYNDWMLISDVMEMLDQLYTVQ